MKTKCDSFVASVERFNLTQRRIRERKERLNKAALDQTERVKKLQRKKIDRLLTIAAANLGQLIQCDDGFLDYLVKIFSSKRVVSFSDGSGACGFPRPSPQWLECLDEKHSLCPKVVSVQKMVGSIGDYEIGVLVLVLYSEYESIKEQCDGRTPADGENSQQSCPVLALTARSDHLSAPNRDQMKDCRLVVVEQQTEDNIMMISYSPMSSVSLDPGFITVLGELSSAKSTFDYFLTRFGPPR